MPITDADKEKWPLVQARLRAVVGEDAYASFLVSLRLEEIDEAKLYCSVPSPFLKKWIKDHYAEELLAAAVQEWPDTTTVYVLRRSIGVPIIIGEQHEETEAPQQGPQRFSYTRMVAETQPMYEKQEDLESDDPPVLPQQGSDRRIHIEEIQQGTGRKYKIARTRLLSRERPRDISLPRQIGMFLSKYMTDRSLHEIGRHFGGRDHTTVVQAIKKIRTLIYSDLEFAYEVASLEAQIRNLTIA